MDHAPWLSDKPITWREKVAMVVHGSAVLLYLGFLGVVALGEKRRVRRTIENMPSTGPCWVDARSSKATAS